MVVVAVKSQAVIGLKYKVKLAVIGLKYQVKLTMIGLKSQHCDLSKHNP